MQGTASNVPAPGEQKFGDWFKRLSHSLQVEWLENKVSMLFVQIDSAVKMTDVKEFAGRIAEKVTTAFAVMKQDAVKDE